MHLEVDEGFPTHRKTLRFCGQLRDPNAIAYLMRLWAWAVRGAPNGNLADLTPADIEGIVGYRPLDGRCYEAMTLAGFIDQAAPGAPQSIHNWMKRTGAAIGRMELEAAAKRKYRAHQKNDGSCGGPGLCNFCDRARGSSTGRPVINPQYAPPPGPNRVLGPSEDGRGSVSPVQSSPDKTRQDQDPDPDRPTPPSPWLGDRGIWSPSTWRDRFAMAWCQRYNLLSYAHKWDSKACADLADILERLHRDEIRQAQGRAADMFTEFFGDASPRALKEKHPFALFVDAFGGLRVPPAPARGMKRSDYPEAK